MSLLVSGCSFTHDTYSFPVWPTILGKNLNVKVINLGQSAAGNDHISMSLWKHISEHHKKIKYVCVLWSDWMRFSLLNSRSQKYSSSSAFFKKLRITQMGGSNELYFNSRKNKISLNLLKLLNVGIYTKRHGSTPMKSRDFGEYNETILEDIVLRNIQYFKNIEMLCNLYNIKYFFMQGTQPLQEYILFSIKKSLNNFKEYCLQYENFFDNKKFIGWCPYDDLNGFDYNILANNNINIFEDRYLSNNDFHPSEKGQQLIASTFLNSIQNE